MTGYLTANFAPRAFALVMRIGTGPADSSRLEQGKTWMPVRLLFTRNLSRLQSSKFSFENLAARVALRIQESHPERQSTKASRTPPCCRKA